MMHGAMNTKCIRGQKKVKRAKAARRDRAPYIRLTSSRRFADMTGIHAVSVRKRHLNCWVSSIKN
jgi:hypothetical protein